MSITSIYLGRKLYEKLSNIDKNSNTTIEELVIKLLSKELSVELDPREEVELHLKLCEKYLSEVEEFLRKGDYIQTSEKAWGATTQIVKALTAKEGRKLESYMDLWGYVSELASKLSDKELRHL